MFNLAILATLLTLVNAIPTPEAPITHELLTRASCPRYTLIDTRGTGEAQGPSAGFRTMNSQILSSVSGGNEYDTVYPADASQNSASGTSDIVNHITTTLASDPSHCFILEGYSQGAAATVNAMSQLTGAKFTAVKGVFLIGNPEHKSGLACNVDTNGGTTTKYVNGLSVYQGGIPSTWVSKTLDVCNFVSPSDCRHIWTDVSVLGGWCLRYDTRVWYRCSAFGVS
jgi:hypothetical protein